jgi:hypothetical protein
MICWVLYVPVKTRDFITPFLTSRLLSLTLLQLVNSEKDLLQLIIDCSASNLIDSQYRKDVDTICRDMIYALHMKRPELLLEW